MGRELELKYRADEEQMATLRSEYGPFHEITMETTYYDTSEKAMGAKRETLRRRYENGRMRICVIRNCCSAVLHV